MSQASRPFVWIGVAALAGIATFGDLAWHSVTMERAGPDEGLRRFDEIRRGLGSAEPMLRVEAAAAVTHRPPPEHGPAARLTRLRVLDY